MLEIKIISKRGWTNKKIKAFVSDFQYDASISLKKLNDLKYIWGDADFRKLHDYEWTKSLKVVMGNFITSTSNNCNGFNELEVVTGDIHIEDLEEMPKFNNLKYIKKMK